MKTRDDYIRDLGLNPNEVRNLEGQAFDDKIEEVFEAAEINFKNRKRDLDSWRSMDYWAPKLGTFEYEAQSILMNKELKKEEDAFEKMKEAYNNLLSDERKNINNNLYNEMIVKKKWIQKVEKILNKNDTDPHHVVAYLDIVLL